MSQSHKFEETALAILFMLKSKKPPCKGLHIACRKPSTLQACNLTSLPHPNILVCPTPPSPTIPQSSWWPLVSQLSWDAQLLRGRRDALSTVFLLLLLLIYSTHIVYKGVYKWVSSVVHPWGWWDFWISYTVLQTTTNLWSGVNLIDRHCIDLPSMSKVELSSF